MTTTTQRTLSTWRLMPLGAHAGVTTGVGSSPLTFTGHGPPGPSRSKHPVTPCRRHPPWPERTAAGRETPTSLAASSGRTPEPVTKEGPQCAG
jgi:hypothetical protein